MTAAHRERITRLAPSGRRITDAIAVVFALWQIYVLTIAAIDTWLLRITHLTFATVVLVRGLSLDVEPRADWRGMGDRLLAWLLIVAAIASCVYVYVNLGGLTFRMGVSPTDNDVVMAAVSIAVLLVLLYRTTGIVLPVLILGFVLYALYGNYLPGMLWNRGYSLARTLSYIYSTEGIYGVPLGVSATYVFIFVLFGALLQASRAGDLFIGLASKVAGGFRGGPAKMAVISSALFGSISGSAVSNVVVSGALTIPMMRRNNYPRVMAGAVEAVASSGGQLMPPVMGAAAFLMADIAGIPYADIAAGALLPALLYFTSLIWIIDLESSRLGLRGLGRDQIPAMREVARNLHLLLPVVIIIYLLLIQRYSPIFAGTWGGIACVVASWVRPGSRLGPVRLLEALARAGRGVAEVAITCAGAGIIIGVLGLTGLGLRIANALMAFSEGYLFLALLISAVVAIILGIGMPTSAAYAISAVVLAPALIQLDVDPLAAHMFVFYFACISTITPPVALAAYAAAPIAEANPMRIGVMAFKLGSVSFLIPFSFVYGPELLMQGEWPAIVHAALTATIGVLALGVAVAGWLIGAPLPWPLRLVAFGAALLLIWHGGITDTLGLGLLLLLVGGRLLVARRAPRVAAALHESTPNPKDGGHP